MKTADFIREHHACREVAKWALSISASMADVWDALVGQEKHEWLLWTATRPGVFSDTVLRKLSCHFVRETPLLDGRKVWDLLADERSRKAVEMAERYADGNATDAELFAAYYAARAAYSVAHISASAAALAAAYSADAATYSADAAAFAAANVAALAAARAAADAAAGRAAAATAAVYAADAAAYAADVADAAQARMIAKLGNPFKGACP